MALTKKINKLQFLIRKALLENASSTTKSKFTGKGYGDNLVLRDDAEEIVCALMRLVAARRTNEVIEVNGAEYKVSDYPKVNGGIGMMQEWDGYAYITESDEEHRDRSLVTVEFPEYEADEYYNDDEKCTAGGRMVSPKRLNTLISSYNAKQDDHNKIKLGEKLSVGSLTMDEVGYMYFKQGESEKIRRIGDGATVGIEMATLLKPTFAGSGLVFGSQSDEEAEQNVLEWLFEISEQ